MSKDQVLGIIRHVLTTAAGMVVAKGYADESAATAVVGGIVALAGLLWSYASKKKS